MKAAVFCLALFVFGLAGPAQAEWCEPDECFVLRDGCYGSCASRQPEQTRSLCFIKCCNDWTICLNKKQCRTTGITCQ